MENIVKVTTTFWTDEVFEFDKLLYIQVKYDRPPRRVAVQRLRPGDALAGRTMDIMYQADLSDKADTKRFFHALAAFMKTPDVLKTVNKNTATHHYQFAVMRDGEIEPVKWFDLVIDGSKTISHDIAFNTTLIKKNQVPVPLGRFPAWTKKKLPRYREFNLKARAYKFMANQIS